MKKCSLCLETKPTSEFSKGSGKDGLYCYCKPCKRLARTQKPNKKFIAHVVDGKKLCRWCNRWLPLSSFGNCTNTRTGKRNYCLLCHKAEALPQSARSRNLECMSKQELHQWLYSVKHICHYCGQPANTIDRLDNTKGYVTGNLAPCCRRCNSVKCNHLTEAQMKIVAKLFWS